MINSAIIILCFLTLSYVAVGQTNSTTNTYTISGYVKDTQTGEALIGATMIIKELHATGVVTNAYGFYSLTIPEGAYTASAQFMGYEALSLPVALQRNIHLNFDLKEKAVEQNEVVISGERLDENVTKTQMGIEKVDVKGIQSVPVLMGEKDVLKTVQLLPGIKSTGDGNSGFYVRGGGYDQNLILLDEATVYSASHLLGFFSVFNSDAIKDLTMYKGVMPAEYGGRLSSALDIKMKEGNDKRFGVNGGIGLIASRLNVEGPIVPEQGSFSVSARRTYVDLFLKLSNDTSINKTRLYFYDVNAKVNYRLDENNRIYLSGYFGKDVLGFGDTFGIDWGNTTGTLRLNHLFSEKMFSNTSLVFSTYSYTINMNFAGSNISIMSKIQDKNIKQDFQYYIDAYNGVKFGLNSIYHTIIPGMVTAKNKTETSTTQLTNKYSWENALYCSHEMKPSLRLNLEYGVRFTSFSVLGPGDFYTYNTSGEPLDTLSYAPGKFITTYFNIEPRLAITYLLNEVSSLKGSYGKTTQNLHLLSNSTSANPTDLWIPNSNNVKPEIAHQVSFGYFRNFRDHSYEFSIETYYKSLPSQIDYKDGAELIFNENVESQLLFGKGRAYGIEFFIKKKFGRLNGWIGYTLSRTELKFGAVNKGTYYPAKQDRTHDLSIVGVYQLSESWTMSAAWVYYSGNAVTFPSGKYEIAGQVLNYYTERNGYRMPAYHRLDLGATWQRDEFSWTFSLYNAYGRDNAYMITFREDPEDPTKTQALQTSLFKFVPSITFNFKF